MSSTKGKLLTCNRCGNTVFLKFLEKVDMDGGFSPSYDKYENKPKEWMWNSEIGDLCPKCAREFQLFILRFMHGDSTKIAPSWKSALTSDDLMEP